jgi:hypothetical protein
MGSIGGTTDSLQWIVLVRRAGTGNELQMQMQIFRLEFSAEEAKKI